MATTGLAQTASSGAQTVLSRWLPVLAGLLVLYVPTYLTLADGPWTREEQAHGPIVLGVFLWLVWRERRVLFAPEQDIWPVAGGVILGLGLLLYILGRSQDILLFEVGSQIPVLAGILLMLVGWNALRRFWFAVFFLVFLIPLPSFIVDTLTAPLKQQVSAIVEQFLYIAGYPVARSGTVLMVGPYQLLVDDACSGINSMYALLALGVLYMYLRGWTRRLHNGLLLAAILPIAFAANIMRVVFLVLITYYEGDAAGQGFLHGFAGIVEFLIALISLFVFDAFIGLFVPERREPVTWRP